MIGRLLFALALLNGCSSTSVNESSGGAGGASSDGSSGGGGSSTGASGAGGSALCAGITVAGQCAFLADDYVSSHEEAQSACMGLGAGWTLCPASVLCTAQVFEYLQGPLCGCKSAYWCPCTPGYCQGPGPAQCGSNGSVQVHTSDAAGSYWVRPKIFESCSGETDLCSATAATCGAALCCRP